MQTKLAKAYRNTPLGDEADRILRSCVHCGFCNATCPTYQLLGDELDGPRGRIYQIKQVLEGAPVSIETRNHLDRCLTCRSCESTCPSGVQYARLADIGRAVVEKRVPRDRKERLRRWGMRQILPKRWRFAVALRLARWFRSKLPADLAAHLPAQRAAPGRWPKVRHTRRVLLLQGCVQPTLAPDIDAAAARVFDAIGVSAERISIGCCGAVAYHLNAQEDGLNTARRAIDRICAGLDRGAEAVVLSASGCASFVAEYGHLFERDAEYAAKAARVVAALRDPSQIVADGRDVLAERFAAQPVVMARVAFQSPCSLQHGLRVRGQVESLLALAGYTCTPVADAHLCCGSAGTYSILQPELSGQLRKNKLAALHAGGAERIATANIGCLTHLATGTETPVDHWLQLLDARLR